MIVCSFQKYMYQRDVLKLKLNLNFKFPNFTKFLGKNDVSQCLIKIAINSVN